MAVYKDERILDRESSAGRTVLNSSLLHCYGIDPVKKGVDAFGIKK